MNATQKKKLCWNCEGRVSLESENCPYCAVYLGPALNEKGNNGVLAPPYKIVETDEQEESAPDAPYSDQEEQTEEVHAEDKAAFAISKNEITEVFLPLVMLSGGLLFSLFGIILFLFSENGELNLKWNGEYWYVYVACALPMLLLGWRFLQKFDEKEEGQRT